jgi:simple sugar transport system permease protein
MATIALRRHVEIISPSRQYTMAALFLVLGGLTWWLFARGLEPDVVTKFGMTPGGSDVLIPDLIFPTKAAINVMAFLQVAAGIYQAVRKGGFKARANTVLFIVGALFVVAFLSWGAAGKSLNMAGLLKTTLVKAVPLTLGAMAGILCERAGVVNIAIEGMMLAGAFTGAFVGSIAQNLWVGLAAAVGAGLLLGLIHAVLSIRYKADQIVSGTVINILATGITSYMSAKFLQEHQEWNNPGIFQPFGIPGLEKIPLLGSIVFDNNIFVYAMIAFMILLQFGLFYTRWGLRHRAVGEHPRAADTLGINVFRTRYIAVLLGAAMAGFGGGYFTLGSVGRFDEVMTAGRGYIALAAMIFGNYNPFGSFGAGLLFGFFDSLASKLAILGIQIPSQFMLMLPYVITILILAGVVGKSHVPAADGEAYEKEGH